MITVCEVCGRPFARSYTEKHTKMLTLVCGPECFSVLLRNREKPLLGNPKGMKLFEHSGDLRSDYERGVARWLLKNGIVYTYEPFVFELADYYVPDFWIARSQVFLEVKGLWEPGAMNKVLLFMQHYPMFRLIVINRKFMSHCGMTPAKMLWGQVCR